MLDQFGEVLQAHRHTILSSLCDIDLVTGARVNEDNCKHPSGAHGHVRQHTHTHTHTPILTLLDGHGFVLQNTNTALLKGKQTLVDNNYTARTNTLDGHPWRRLSPAVCLRAV